MPAQYTRNSAPNFSRIPFESLRRRIDMPYFEAVEDLKEAYYNAWQHGRSQPWKGLDVQATPRASKQLYDDLLGLLGDHYDVEFHQTNMDQPLERRHPEERYDFELADDGVTPRRKSTRGQRHIEAWKARGIEFTIA